MATSKTWIRTLKKLDPEKHEINMGLKKCQALENCFRKTMRNVSCSLKVHKHITTCFRLTNCSYNNSTVKWKPENIKSGLCFSCFMNHKDKIYVSTHQI